MAVVHYTKYTRHVLFCIIVDFIYILVGYLNNLYFFPFGNMIADFFFLNFFRDIPAGLEYIRASDMPYLDLLIIIEMYIKYNDLLD